MAQRHPNTLSQDYDKRRTRMHTVLDHVTLHAETNKYMGRPLVGYGYPYRSAVLFAVVKGTDIKDELDGRRRLVTHQCG